MVWQDMTLFSGPHLDAEEEREMRLAAQARAGADWALAALVARYQPPVYRYLTRLTGDGPRARALSEQIFVRMEKRLRGPHGAQHLRLWLLRACTELGLDALRRPQRSAPPARLTGAPAPRGLLPERIASRTSQRLRSGLDRLAQATGTTRRQVRQLVWSEREEQAEEWEEPSSSQSRWQLAEYPDDELDKLNPRDALRHRLVRAVLAELPYGDAQCLALHLVADLNQTEVADALGIRASAARKRIVQGLQMFASRYEAALISLGLPLEAAYADPAPVREYPPEPLRQPERGVDRIIATGGGQHGSMDDEPLWQQPPEPQGGSSPMASASSHRMAARFSDLPDTAEAVDEPLTEAPAEEPSAIPIAEEAITGPIVDSVAAMHGDSPAFDFASSAPNEAEPLGYTVVVEQPVIVDADVPVGAGTSMVVRQVPVLSRGPILPPSAIVDEVDPNDTAESDTRVIPVVTPGYTPRLRTTNPKKR